LLTKPIQEERRARSFAQKTLAAANISNVSCPFWLENRGDRHRPPLFRGRARASSVQGWLLGRAAHNRCLETNPWGADMGKRSRGRRDHPFHFAIATLALAAAARAQATVASQPRAEAAAAEIRIVSTEFKFVPATVRALAGRPVTLVLDNSGARPSMAFLSPPLGFAWRRSRARSRGRQLFSISRVNSNFLAIFQATARRV
jgi:hypothetical protein